MPLAFFWDEDFMPSNVEIPVDDESDNSGYDEDNERLVPINTNICSGCSKKLDNTYSKCENTDGKNA
jgi:hypothetical protein